MKKTAQEMENYMKNDLSKEKAELRKKKDGPNCLLVFNRNRNSGIILFYMKYLPHFLYYYELNQL